MYVFFLFYSFYKTQIYPHHSPVHWNKLMDIFESCSLAVSLMLASFIHVFLFLLLFPRIIFYVKAKKTKNKSMCHSTVRELRMTVNCVMNLLVITFPLILSNSSSAKILYKHFRLAQHIVFHSLISSIYPKFRPTRRCSKIYLSR